MAININPGTPLRQVATFNSSSNFTPPAGTNIVFVSIHAAAGGGGGGTFSGTFGAGGAIQAGGNGLIGSAFVQVIPSVAVPVVAATEAASETTSTDAALLASVVEFEIAMLGSTLPSASVTAAR